MNMRESLAHVLQAQEKKALWWLQFVAVVEAKRNYDQNDKELITQLLGYLRLVMVEQKDRRFAIGLFLSRNQLSVWCHDRSGVLGMDVPILIHEVRLALSRVRFTLT